MDIIEFEHINYRYASIIQYISKIDQIDFPMVEIDFTHILEDLKYKKNINI